MKRCRSRLSVNLYVVRPGRWLQVLVPAHLVVRHVASESQHSFLSEPLRSPARLRMVYSIETSFEARYFGYGIEKLGDELLPVAGYYVVGSAVRLDPELQERDDHCDCRSTAKLDSPLHFG